MRDLVNICSAIICLIVLQIPDVSMPAYICASIGLCASFVGILVSIIGEVD